MDEQQQNTPPVSGPTPVPLPPTQHDDNQPLAPGDHVAPTDPTPKTTETDPQDPIEEMQPKRSSLLKSTFGALIIVGGIMIGLTYAFIANFCFKDCPDKGVFIESSIIWAPLLSLLFTIPIRKFALYGGKQNGLAAKTPTGVRRVIRIVAIVVGIMLSLVALDLLWGMIRVFI